MGITVGAFYIPDGSFSNGKRLGEGVGGHQGVVGSPVGGALVGLLCALAHRLLTGSSAPSQETALWSVAVWLLGNFGDRGTEVPA